MFACVLALVLLQLSVAQDIRLFGGSSSNEGRVEVRVDGRWGTVCNTTWDIDDTAVVCRELGNRTALMSDVMFGEGQGAILFDDVMCTGDEARLDDCPHSTPSVDTCQHTQDAGVRCSPKDEDVRLSGGSNPHEGRVEIYRSGKWGRVCADSSWDKREADVVCRTVGYPNGAENPRRSFGTGNSRVFLTSLVCTGKEATVLACNMGSFSNLTGCPVNEEDIGVVCVPTVDVVTEELSTGAIAGIGIGFGIVIVVCCLFSLNCKCRPCWKKRELDETDVYQCNTGSGADTKVYSTASNIKSDQQSEPVSDIDPNMFVFAPKVPPAGFGAPPTDSSIGNGTTTPATSGTNGMLPNIEEAKNSEKDNSQENKEKEKDSEKSAASDHVVVSMATDEHKDKDSVDPAINAFNGEDNVMVDPQGGAHYKKDNDVGENEGVPRSGDGSGEVSGDNELAPYHTGALPSYNVDMFDTRL